jgi:hypothetical protein
MDSIDIVQSILIDSLISVVTDISENKTSDSINILRTIGSSSIIILIFIIERLINSKKNDKLSQREFLQNIIIIPNVNEIKGLFESYFTKLENSISELRNFKGSGDQTDQEKRNKLSELKDHKINFDHQFISLVRSVDLIKAVELTDKINGLDDVATRCLSTIDMASIDIVTIKKEIHNSKSEFYKILYS